MNWTRLSPTESIAGNDRGSTIARVWFTGAGWFGSTGGQQEGPYEDESSAREWCEVALAAKELRV